MTVRLQLDPYHNLHTRDKNKKQHKKPLTPRASLLGCVGFFAGQTYCRHFEMMKTAVRMQVIYDKNEKQQKILLKQPEDILDQSVKQHFINKIPTELHVQLIPKPTEAAVVA